MRPSAILFDIRTSQMKATSENYLGFLTADSLRRESVDGGFIGPMLA